MAKRRAYVHAGVISNGYITVQHALNIQDSYAPLCQIGRNDTALIIYNTFDITPNSFKLGLMAVDGYVLSQPTDGQNINIIWTY